jgi:hypothetical protein
VKIHDIPCARGKSRHGVSEVPEAVQLANSDEVPVRLILGVDAEKRVQQAEAARAAEAEKWRHLTVSTVFEDGLFDSRLNMAKGSSGSGSHP